MGTQKAACSAHSQDTCCAIPHPLGTWAGTTDTVHRALPLMPSPVTGWSFLLDELWPNLTGHMQPPACGIFWAVALLTPLGLPPKHSSGVDGTVDTLGGDQRFELCGSLPFLFHKMEA